MRTVLRTLLVVPVAAVGLRPQSADVSTRVEQLLGKMTLEEKAGQMTQVTLAVVARNAAGDLDPERLENAVVRNGVGSILNVVDHAYSPERWHRILNQIQDMVEKTRLKIPVLYGIDAIHGANYTTGATLFPQAIAMAATWNPELARRAGEITAYQVRASGIPWNFYPVLDLGRQPLWPRFWETFGEDVLLATEMGKAYIRGLQGGDVGARDRVAACLKHYAGYSFPFTGKDRTPAWMDERLLRQYFLPPFEAGVREGVLTVMVNSGEINGIPGHANYRLLTEILKQEWGFPGFVVSDWEDVKRLHTRDRIAESLKDAVRIAVMAGVDMSMVPMDFSFRDLVIECAREGLIPMSRIDDAVRRILRVKFLTGLFDRPRPDSSLLGTFHRPEFEQTNLEAAREAITLLKNRNGLLPLGKNRRLLVTGPAADSRSALNGGWTITWQGDREELYPKDKLTILGALRAAAGERVRYVPGASFDRALDVAAAVRAAVQAEVIVAVLGERAYCETPGNIDDLTLEEAQRGLVRELAKTGKPIVTVLVEGRPRVLREVADFSDAIVLAYLPGMEGGKAIAEVLFGDVNPSGRLPFTYPRFPNALTPYDHKYAEQMEGNVFRPQWEFGFGLSYTSFAYSDLKLSPEKMARDGELAIRVTVRNSGSRRGKEVVQLYVSDLYRSVTPPVKELKGFQKIELGAGESRVVTFRLRSRDLSFIGLDNRRVTEPGRFRVSIGGLSAEFTLE
jgi:beta-glucosidase